MVWYLFPLFFFFNDTATTEIYTLSLHDALPICRRCSAPTRWQSSRGARARSPPDRKSTRLNSSHQIISYAVFCLKNKKMTNDVSDTTSTRLILTAKRSQSSVL